MEGERENFGQRAPRDEPRTAEPDGEAQDAVTQTSDCERREERRHGGREESCHDVAAADRKTLETLRRDEEGRLQREAQREEAGASARERQGVEEPESGCSTPEGALGPDDRARAERRGDEQQSEVRVLRPERYREVVREAERPEFAEEMRQDRERE